MSRLNLSVMNKMKFRDHLGVINGPDLLIIQQTLSPPKKLVQLESLEFLIVCWNSFSNNKALSLVTDSFLFLWEMI